MKITVKLMAVGQQKKKKKLGTESKKPREYLLLNYLISQ